METMKKAAIFDMDGVLFDTERLYCDTWHRMTEERGLGVSEEFTSTLRGTTGKGSEAVIHRFYPDLDAAAFYAEGMRYVKEYTKHTLPEKPGVRELLQWLKENGWPIAIASSTDVETIKDHLELAKISSYFDVIVGGGDVQNGKPAPDIFLLAAERLGRRPQECFVFEDSPNGIRAACAAGCKAVMIPDLSPADEEMKEKACICSSLLEVREKFLNGEW